MVKESNKYVSRHSISCLFYLENAMLDWILNSLSNKAKQNKKEGRKKKTKLRRYLI
jgi:hypothetical protein